MNNATVLSHRLSMIGPETDHEMSRIHEVVEHKVVVEGRADLEAMLGRRLAEQREPAESTLDLIGHSSSRGLLVLGDWEIDGTKRVVRAFFRELRDNDVFARLGVTELRLLGCETGKSDLARTTLAVLSELLDVDVLGTTQVVYSAHYDRAGFRDECRHMLVTSAGILPDRGATPSHSYRRNLDLDAIPSILLDGSRPRWPRHIASIERSRALLQHIQRSDGAQMPGLLATPQYEIALASARAGWYYRIQVLLDGQFVRMYPDGEHEPGVLFPVTHPAALHALVTELPLG